MSVVVAALQDIRSFLAQKRIAVVGVSRKRSDFSNRLFRDLRNRGYDVLPVNPRAKEIEGARCFESVRDIRPAADAALILTPPDTTAAVARDCVAAGIKRIWMYRAVGPGAVNPSAVEYCEQNGVRVIPGFCPYMFLPDSGVFHKFHGFVMKVTRTYPA